jgi:uncharacterized linocin/CFP29 family protein
MDHLRRDLAPISDAAWSAIEDEASRTLRHVLAARALVDFDGPHSWEYAALGTGRTRDLEPVAGRTPTSVAAREVQPLLELRTPFTLSRAELDAIDRGAVDPDLDPVTVAAQALGTAEDRLVFHGSATVRGIVTASVHSPLSIPEDFDTFPRTVAQAVAALRDAGVGGPYGMAMGPRCYTTVLESSEHGGYPLLEHVKLILGGPVMWAPAVDGSVLLSLRGGDHTLVVGEDTSIGYAAHDATSVQLYLEESIAMQVRDPRAAIGLVYPA